MYNSPKQIKQSNRVLSLVLAITAILLGGIIYLLLRPQPALFFEWFTCLRINEQILTIRDVALPFRHLFPDWIIFSFPNLLWAFSYSIFIGQLWLTQTSKIKYVWFISAPLLVIGFEYGQLFDLISGTFCWYDILFALLGILLGFISSLKLQFKSHKSYPRSWVLK